MSETAVRRLRAIQLHRFRSLLSTVSHTLAGQLDRMSGFIDYSKRAGSVKAGSANSSSSQQPTSNDSTPASSSTPSTPVEPDTPILGGEHTSRPARPAIRNSRRKSVVFVDDEETPKARRGQKASQTKQEQGTAHRGVLVSTGVGDVLCELVLTRTNSLSSPSSTINLFSTTASPRSQPDLPQARLLRAVLLFPGLPHLSLPLRTASLSRHHLLLGVEASSLLPRLLFLLQYSLHLHLRLPSNQEVPVSCDASPTLRPTLLLLRRPLPLVLFPPSPTLVQQQLVPYTTDAMQGRRGQAASGRRTRDE